MASITPRTLSASTNHDKAFSPPTARVIAVLERLNDRPGLTASQLARDVGANRSTITAVLNELVRTRWVERSTELTFSLGPALNRLRTADVDDALVATARRLLSRLTSRTGYGAAMVRVGDAELEFLVLTGSAPQQLPPGIVAGTRLPLRSPGSVSVAAHRPARERRAWLEHVPRQERASMRAFMDAILERGAGVWRLDRDHTGVFEVLSEITGTLGPEHGGLRARALAELFTLSHSGYSAAELDSAATFSVSRIVVPLVGASGHSGFELDLGILRPNVSRDELHGCLEMLREVAAELVPLLP